MTASLGDPVSVTDAGISRLVDLAAQRLRARVVAVADDRDLGRTRDEPLDRAEEVREAVRVRPRPRARASVSTSTRRFLELASRR